MSVTERSGTLWAEHPQALGMLKALVAEGHSKREISIILTDTLGVPVSLNTVGGKCARMGLQLLGRRWPEPASEDEAVKRARRRYKKPAVSASPVAAANGGGCGRLTFARRAIAAKQGLPTDVPFCEPVHDDRADHPTVLTDLKHDTCRWPFGDPARSGFHFCGGLALDGHPYCARHTQRATNPRIPESYKVAAE